MIAIFTAQALLTAAVLLWLAFEAPPNKASAAVVIGAAALALIGVGAAGIWVYPPLWFYAVFATVSLALLGRRVWRRGKQNGVGGSLRAAVRVAGLAVWTVLGGLLLWHGVLGRIAPTGDTLDLAAPLSGPGFCAVSGGSSPLLNFHMETLAPDKRAYRGQSYGVDLIAISPLGVRTRPGYQFDPAPRDPDAYRIFGAAVSAPCAGEVVASYDGMGDHDAGEPDLSQMAGNHVILRCEQHDVLLAHLRQGSVAVSAGQRVAVGARLGEVGNTGASDEPHLHISAQRAVDPQPAFSGEPVQITFSGRVLARGACL
jgi:hypothetical protein